MSSSTTRTEIAAGRAPRRPRAFHAFLGWLMDACAGALLATTPFVAFVRHNEYPLVSPEIALCLAGLAGIGVGLGTLAAAGGAITRAAVVSALLVLWIDLQTRWFDANGSALAAAFVASCALCWMLRLHLRTITVAATLAALGASLLMPGAGPWTTVAAHEPDMADVTDATDSTGIEQRALPPILHIVLDEQIGPAGVPRAFDRDGSHAASLGNFYVDRGFRVFDRAFSRYYRSEDSIPHLVNFTADAERSRYIARPEGVRSLTANAYFDEMQSRGYRIHVVQSDYLDFCAGRNDLARCTTYQAESIRPLASAPLESLDKVRIIAGMYVRLSHFLVALRDGLYPSLRERAAEASIELPAWDASVGRVSPLATLGVLKALGVELTTASRGTLVFAHLLLPHSPYAYDAQCRIRPDPAQWLLNHPGRGAFPRNTPASRATRYPRYLAQVACTHRALGELFGRLEANDEFRDAIVLIHGDHGSRIALLPPYGQFEKRLSPADFADSFSTLFAIRHPDLSPGRDPRLLPIDSLFESLIRNGGIPDGVEWSESQEVYLRSGSGAMKAHPMPALGR